MCRFTCFSVLFIFSSLTHVSSVAALGSGKRLVRHTSTVTWTQANQTCHENGHRLVTVDSYTRYCLQHASRTASRNNARPVWIGMYKRDLPETLRGEDEVFRWTDCTPVSSWAVENLVTTRDTGRCVGARGPSLRWKVYECGSLFGFVCESSVQLMKKTSTCTYYPQTLSCIWEDADFVHDSTSSCKITCIQSFRCWGFVLGTFTVTAGSFHHDPTAVGCTLLEAETIRTCRPVPGGSYYVVLKLCYEYETTTSNLEHVHDLPTAPSDTCSLADLTNSTTPLATSKQSIRTTISGKGTRLPATRETANGDFTTRAEITLPQDAPDTQSIYAADPGTPPTPGAEANTSQTSEAEPNTQSTPEVETNIPVAPKTNTPPNPVAEANTPPTPEAVSDTPPTPLAESNISPTPEAETNTPLTPDAETNTPPTPEAETNTPPTPEAETNTPPTPEAETNTLPTPEAGTNIPPSPDAEINIPPGAEEDPSKPASVAETSTPTPVAETSTPVPVAETSTPTPEAETNTPTSVAETNTPTSEAETSTPTPEAETNTPTSGAETSTPTSEAETSTPTPEAETSTPTSGAETSTPTSEAETSTPTPEAETNTPTPGAETSTPTPEAETSTPTPEAETSTPTPGAETSTPTSGAETSTPTPGAETSTPTPEAETSTPTSEAETNTPAMSGVGPSGPHLPDEDRSVQSAADLDPSTATMYEEETNNLSSLWKINVTDHSTPKTELVSSAAGQAPPTSKRQCGCSCAAATPKNRAVRQNVSTSLRTIKKSLRVVTANLSATRRRKESAQDLRPSAQTAGAFSIFILTAVGMVIVLPDLRTAAAAVARELRLSWSKRRDHFSV